MHPVTTLNRVFNGGAVLLLFLIPALASAARAAETDAQISPWDSLEYWLGPDQAGIAAPMLWRASVGTEYARYTLDGGNTGPSDAEAWMSFYALSVTRGAWTLGVNGSYQRFTAPVPEIGIPALTNRTISGLGDTSISLRYDIDAVRTLGWFTSVTARVKAPTASAGKGLGTGKLDGTLAFDAIRPIGRWAVFAYGGHTWRGEHQRLTKTSTWNASGGVDYRLASTWNVGASYDWRQLGVGGETSAIYTYVRHRITDRISITGYSIAGLDRNSPDYSLGLQLSMFGLW